MTVVPHNMTRTTRKPNYKKHIHARGYTQIQLARELGVSYKAMNNFLNGRAENMHVEILLRRWIRKPHDT